MQQSVQCFASFAPAIREQSPLRQAITLAYRRAEPECISLLLDQVTLPPTISSSAAATATSLIEALRTKHRGTGIAGLVQEYSLSSPEGVALMCLAEAMLRIPDNATRDMLIRDKITGGNWKEHFGGDRSLFVNAATWGLVITGKLVEQVDHTGLAAALSRLIGRCGEPVIRRGVALAMRMMGEQFVSGESIDEALKRAPPSEARGFAFSYDMLGEAAATATDAERYYKDYERAIHAIGSTSKRRGIYLSPGISIKLSALHPRYCRAQSERVMGELLPRVKTLAALARSYDIGFNIDAEEADRLEISLDLLEELALDPDLSGWQGLGFVVQTYSKRGPYVLDFIIDLAIRARRRIMVRLVKGAYWDAEIKRAQVDGLNDFPVYTRKVYTDLAYLACARKLLDAPKQVFAQFATHNAQTVAAIYHMAGPSFAIGDYEFQCLHGMGEPLYEEVVGKGRLNRPCRIYAPVGTHQTLLAYLVRRLLENGANSSFVNQITDPMISTADLVASPVDLVHAMEVPGQAHEQIALPPYLLDNRRNSSGIDLSNEEVLSGLDTALRLSRKFKWEARPTNEVNGVGRPIFNPGDHRDVVGTVVESTPDKVPSVCERAVAALPAWSSLAPGERASLLETASDIMQNRMPILLGLIMREAGKTLPNAVGEVREAIDFLRYYAQQARCTLGPGNLPLGIVACISPWNFPLAIFTGQIAAALVAGNTVIAKPAEQTPLIAAETINILHEAGISSDVLQLLLGNAQVGNALISAPQIAAVIFTGSTNVAQHIHKQLSQRLSPFGKPLTLIAETGGQNAMIVDSSALAEQVVADVISSAFDSAGQRCSALRVLCIQHEVADNILAMLKGAMQELSIGKTDRLSVDIGPIITEEAKKKIDFHIENMRRSGHIVEQIARVGEVENGTFVLPTIIEIASLIELKNEIFGPVLHIIRYKRSHLQKLIEDINAMGYGLTLGIHTRLDETIDFITSRSKAGNIYVNRNTVGAVVGVQPFGGLRLSGTGPKAGGPLYLSKLLMVAPAPLKGSNHHGDSALVDHISWLESQGFAIEADAARAAGRRSLLDYRVILHGPVGETNSYSLHPRGRILLFPLTPKGLRHQLTAILATGNHAVVHGNLQLRDALTGAPASVIARIEWMGTLEESGHCAGVLIEGDSTRLLGLQKKLAERDGPLLSVQVADLGALGADYSLDWLLEEVSTSINTTAAGGNASLMAIA